LSQGEPRKRLEELDAVLAALAHPARRQILLVVRFRGGAMSAGEIAERFHHTWPTTSRHLRVLVKAGLLQQQKQGRVRMYRLSTARLEVLKDWLRWFEPPSPDEAKPE
jgi:DNA-binding transcriptional ArsR family regulator